MYIYDTLENKFGQVAFSIDYILNQHDLFSRNPNFYLKIGNDLILISDKRKKANSFNCSLIKPINNKILEEANSKLFPNDLGFVSYISPAFFIKIQGDAYLIKKYDNQIYLPRYRDFYKKNSIRTIKIPEYLIENDSIK